MSASRRLVLASASPARLTLLRQAGLDPEVIVSGVDEDALVAAWEGAPPTPTEVCQLLATGKTRSVAMEINDDVPALVIGCDSVLELDGQAMGKPRDSVEALARWADMAGRWGVLRTGHHVIDQANGREVFAAASTRVHFADPDSSELAAYISTGEPLAVAGAFTIDGLGAAFVQRIEGDHSNVVGLSLPLLRLLLKDLGIRWTDLWSNPA